MAARSNPRPAKAPRKAAATKPKPRARPPKPTEPVEISNVDRTRAELRGMGEELAGSSLAGAALTLARDLDSRTCTAAEHAACSRALLAIMIRLYQLAPAKPARDGLDRVRGQRDRRRRRLHAVK